MYRRKPKFRRFNNKPKSEFSSVQNTKNAFDESFEPPKDDVSTKDSMSLVRKSFGQLQNLRTIDVKVDPTASMSYGSFPYTIIGATNPIVDAKYGGDENISGNSIVQLQNDTSKSALMDVFDSTLLKVSINYNYLPIRSNAKNVALLAEYVKTVGQAVSYGFSTMLTELPFYSEYVEVKDMPVPEQCEVQIDGETLPSTDYQYTARLIHYQTVLQNLVKPVSNYITLLSMEKELMRMSFRLEAPLITQLYGLFKKASFMANINTIGTVVLNEYFDENWFKQTNLIDALPARKTKGMVDPLVNIVTVHAIPHIKIKTAKEDEAPVYDSEEVLKHEFIGKRFDPETFITTEHDVDHPYTYTLETLILDISTLLNPHTVLKFCRQKNQKIGPAYTTQISRYAQFTNELLTILTDMAARFSSLMGHTRTFIDKLDVQSLVYWRKGFTRFVEAKDILQYEPRYNALLIGIYKAFKGDTEDLYYNDNTKRWRAWTTWDKYFGIPEYNKTSHGAFLTAGLRDIEIPSGYTSSSAIMLLPVLFNYNDEVLVGKVGTCVALSRAGVTLTIDKEVYNENQIIEHPQFHRLSPLGNVKSIRVPVATIPEDQYNAWRANPDFSISKGAAWSSAASAFMTSLFDYAEIVDLTHIKDAEGSYDSLPRDTQINNSIICFIDFELQDVSNDMIVFARNYGPFRSSTPNGDRTMGFASVNQSRRDA